VRARKQRGGRAVGGQPERRDGELVFGAQAQRGAAGRQDNQPRAAGEQISDKRRGVEHRLKAVQHQQHPPRPQVRLDQAGHRVAGRVHPDRAGHQRGDQRGVAGLRQRDETNPIRKVAAQRGRRLYGQPGLPDAAHASEGEQPHLRVAQPGHDGGEFPLASDQPGRWHRRRRGRLARAGPATASGRLEPGPLIAG
jgi:hypothetical protein